MTEPDIIKENDNFRVYLELDPYADEPYDEGSAPILRIDTARNHAEHIDAGKGGRDTDSAIESAVQHWRASPSNADWRLVETYLRAFYGTTKIDTWYSGDYWYVGYDTSAWREAMGIAPDYKITEDFLSEWRAWVEGEVYSYVVERRVREETVTRELDGTEIDRTEIDSWETVDACSGFYGDDYACEAALEAYNYAIGK